MFARALLAIALAIAAAMPTAVRAHDADAGWFEAGDMALRLDLQLLNDAEVIQLPLNQWPLPRAAVRYAIAHARRHFATNAAVAAALERMRQRVDVSVPSLSARLTVGEAGLLRDFDTPGRDKGELRARADLPGKRFSGTMAATGVADPTDGRSFRFDGSQATVRAGNWLLSAHMLDRWWGPGHEGSLILSSNARPMPTIALERAEARRFESRWLEWLGPWRFSFGISQMESERADVDSPLFMAWRVVVMPFKGIELGFSRTAQFCGDHQPCDLDTFGNMLAGNDNVGFDATEDAEPGNQMAGFDLRWASPIGHGPYAVYAQMIGEDESSYLPAKYLGQFGLEVWKPFVRGGVLHVFAEYSSTTCSANSSSGPYYNCAYNQGRFDMEGYRYRGRVIGHTSDRDAENYAVGATVTAASGALWSATARKSRLNRDDFGDFRNTVSLVPTTYHALELGWKGSWRRNHIELELGIEALEPAGGGREVEPFGFVSWRYDYRP